MHDTVHDAGSQQVETPELPPGVLCARLGPGANCSSAGSAIDVLFYGSVLVGALAVALAAVIPPTAPHGAGGGGGEGEAGRGGGERGDRSRREEEGGPHD